MGYAQESDINIVIRQEQALRTLITETSRLTGQSYFNKITCILGEVFHADFSFIGLLQEETHSVHTLALAQGSQLGENITYDLDGTPCDKVIERGACSYLDKTQDLFPQDALLEEMNIRAYVGTTIFSPSGEPLGILVSLFQRSIEKWEADLASYVFELFAHNISAELDRIKKEREIQESESNLRAIIENTQDVILSLNRELDILMLNSVAKHSSPLLFNVALEQGMNIKQAFDAATFKKYKPHIDRCLNGERFTTIDFRQENKQPRYYEFSYNPIWNNASIAGISIGIKDTTYRVLARKKLQDSESKSRSIVSSLSEGVVLHDATGKIVLHNRAACSILKVTESQLLGATPMDPQWQCFREDGSPFPGEEHPASISLMKGIPCHNVIMGVKTPDTSLSWILINSIPIFDQQTRQLKSVTVSFSDITPIKEAEKKIQDSEKKYKLLAQHSVDIISTHDRAGTYLYVSPAINHLVGLEEAEVLGLHPVTLAHPDDREQVEEGYRNFMKRHNQKRLIYRMKRKSGDYIWVESIGTMLEDKQQKQTELIVLTRDISEIKRAELALIASEQEKGNLLIALDNAALVSISDLTGKITHVNKKLCHVSGYTEEELIGQSHSIFGSGYHTKKFWASMWQKIGKGHVWRGEVKNKTKSGEEYWVDTVITPIKNQDGEIYEYMSIRYLITDKKKLFEHRERLLDDLEEYAFITSHQLRGPLARMLGLTGLITAGHIGMDELGSISTMILETSEEMDEIIVKMNQVLGRTLYSEDIEKQRYPLNKS